MSDYQNIIEQSIHSIVDIAYKQGYQDGQKSVENEKYTRHTYWFKKGYQRGYEEAKEENLLNDITKGETLLDKLTKEDIDSLMSVLQNGDEEMPDEEIKELLRHHSNDGEHPRMKKIFEEF